MSRLNRMALTNVSQMLLDILTILFTFVLTWQILRIKYEITGIVYYLWILIIFGTILFFSMLTQDMYSRSQFKYHDRIVRNVFQACLLASFVCLGVLSSVAYEPNTKKFLGIYILICTAALTIQWTVTSSLITIKEVKKAPHAIFVGNLENINQYLYYLKKSSFVIHPVGYISNECSTSIGTIPCLGMLDDLETIISENIVDEVIFAMSHTFVGKVEKYMEYCELRGLTVKVALDFDKISLAKSFIVSVGPIPVIIYHTVSLNELQNVIKRLMDIIGASIGLVLTFFVSLFIIPAIKLDSQGSILFKQQRMGKNGRTFMLFKFRSMCVDAESMKKKLENQNQVKDGMMFKIKDDPRITRVGSFLRKTSLDELPQFINVLMGDMSLVGTRPPTMDEVSKYSNNHYRRISIKPGITGLWQVSGRSSITDFNEVVQLDTQYIDNWSVWKDFSIIIRTILMILLRRQSAF